MKVAFFEGRPHGHPLHRKYAKSVKATFFHIDYLLRYQDIKTTKFKRIISILLTIIFFISL